jgi:sialate O-acetylesterase
MPVLSSRLKLARCAALVAILLGTVAALQAAITLAPPFSDGAVLQRDKPLAVWGTGKPGESVHVVLAGQVRSATTGPDGRWLAMFDAVPANPVGCDLVAASKEGTITLHDIIFGDVWLCSGQSNMEFTVSRAQNADREIAAANFPLIRHLRIERQIAEKPADQVATSGWKPALPANVGEFTAVGYFFARDLHQRVGVPIGLIHSSWGGTPVEAWMSPMALAADPAFSVVAQRWHEKVANFPAAQAAYEARMATWTAGEAQAKAAGEKAHALWLRQNPKPWPAGGGPEDPWAPSGLYNGMINPLVPYALRGVLWYQGESNAGHASEYHALFAAMITAWRAHFAQGDVPFFWVNLANWRPNDPTDLAWATLREAQTQTLSLPSTGQAIAVDIGDPIDIHPRNKQEVGRRLALLAKHRVYGLTADDTGPVFASATRDGGALRVRFTHAGGGLVSHNKPPQALELAGADRVFRPAIGRIDRETLVVSSPQVKEPIAVRYAWHNCPEANLYGGSGLPVVPFRSDNW